MQKPRAQIINFDNNRKFNKSIVFVLLLTHYFATCICSTIWYVNHFWDYVLRSLTDVVFGKFIQYHYIVY